MHLHYCQFYAHAIRTIAGKAAWRLFVRFPSHLFRVNGRRWVTTIEQATFNVARQLGEGIISTSAIMTRARRVIGETTQFLAQPDNKLLQIDLWSRFVYFTDSVRELNQMMRAIEGRASTVIIAKGFPNACTVATLLARYACAVTDAPQVATRWYHADLAASGLYSVTKFTRDFANWSFNIEDVIILAMDLSMRCNVNISGTHAANTGGLERYTSRVP